MCLSVCLSAFMSVQFRVYVCLHVYAQMCKTICPFFSFLLLLPFRRSLQQTNFTRETLNHREATPPETRPPCSKVLTFHARPSRGHKWPWGPQTAPPTRARHRLSSVPPDGPWSSSPRPPRAARGLSTVSARPVREVTVQVSKYSELTVPPSRVGPVNAVPLFGSSTAQQYA